MIFQANHHAHSSFSDGKFPAEEYLERAIEQGFAVYGFSDHAPVPIDRFGSMEMHELPDYLAEVDRLKSLYGNRVQIYKGLEVDYIPGIIDIHSPHIQEAKLDYTIGAVHFVENLPSGRPWGFQSSHRGFEEGLEIIFKGDIKACIRRYYELIREMIDKACPDIIAHLDRVKRLNRGDRYFREQDDWYQQEVSKTLEAIANAGAIMEINTKGLYSQVTDDTYPGKWVLELALEMDIPVHLGSDAHHPDNLLGGFEYAADLLHKVGYKAFTILFDGIWQDVPLKTPRLYPMS